MRCFIIKDSFKKMLSDRRVIQLIQGTVIHFKIKLKNIDRLLKLIGISLVLSASLT